MSWHYKQVSDSIKMVRMFKVSIVGLEAIQKQCEAVLMPWWLIGNASSVWRSNFDPRRRSLCNLLPSLHQVLQFIPATGGKQYTFSPKKGRNLGSLA